MKGTTKAQQCKEMLLGHIFELTQTWLEFGSDLTLWAHIDSVGAAESSDN